MELIDSRGKMDTKTQIKKVKNFGGKVAYQYIISDLNDDSYKGIKCIGFASDRQECQKMAHEALVNLLKSNQ